MWPFKPSETPPDTKARHDTVLDLIEQVAALRGQVRSIETEWDDVKGQVRKAYQRIEKATQRAEEREEPDEEPGPKPAVSSLNSFAAKIQAMRSAK